MTTPTKSQVPALLSATAKVEKSVIILSDVALALPKGDGAKHNVKRALEHVEQAAMLLREIL